MSPISRLRPWPYHARVRRASGEWVGLVLRTAEDGGLLYGKKTVVGQAITPTEYGYANYDPFKERPFVYGPLTGGMGERVQRTQTRYKHAIDADLSVGQRRRGPALVETLPAATGYVLGFAEGLHGGTNTLFAWVRDPGTFDARVLRRTGDGSADWVLSNTATFHRQMVRFKPEDNTAGDYLYATANGGGLSYYDGAAWAAATLPANTRAEYAVKIGTELWVGGWDFVNGAHVAKASTDPRIAASWSAPISVGDASSTVTWLAAVGDALVVFKTDGLYTVNADGTTNDLTPELGRLAGWRGEGIWDTDFVWDQNGTNATTWNGAVYFNFAGRSWRAAPSGDALVLEPVGLSLFYGNDTEVTGYQTAFAGDTFFGWYAYYDPVGGNSYLCKQGTYLNADAAGGFEYADVTNGAVRKFAGRKVTALHVSSVPGPNERLYVGFADGGIGWIVLPRNSPDPATDPNCRYHDGPGYVYWPDHHAGAQADAKHWRAFAAVGPHLDADDSVSVAYRYTDADAWTDLGTDLTVSGARVNTPGSVASNVLQVREALNGTATTTPDVDAVVLFEQTRPAMVREYTCSARLALYQARRDGTPDRRPPESTRAALLEVVGGAGPVEIEMPDETNQDIDAVDYAEVMAPDHRSYGHAWDVSLRFLEFRTNTVEGTWGDVAGLTWGELAAYRWGQLPTI